MADRLILNGAIDSSGALSVDNSVMGGAGGSINIDVNEFLGTGSLKANGSGYDTSTADNKVAGGGRISISVESSDNFSGVAEATVPFETSSEELSGTGTVFYKKPNHLAGDLQVTRSFGQDTSGMTKVKGIGKQPITKVTPLGSNLWELESDTSVETKLNFSGFLSNGSGGVGYHTFELEEEQPVNIHVTQTYSGFDPHIYIIRNKGPFFTISVNDEIASVVGNELSAVVPAGTYYVVIGDYNLTYYDMTNNRNYGSSGNYALELTTKSLTPKLWNIDELKGQQVLLDATNENGEAYTIVSNTEYKLVIYSESNLSTFGDGNFEMIGVHTFDTISITNGSSVDFGEDYIRVLNASDSVIDESSSVISGNITDGIPNAEASIFNNKWHQEKEIEFLNESDLFDNTIQWDTQINQNVFNWAGGKLAA